MDSTFKVIILAILIVVMTGLLWVSWASLPWFGVCFLAAVIVAGLVELALDF